MLTLDSATMRPPAAPGPAILTIVLFLTGPLLKVRDWESTGVLELRAHAAGLASRLLPG